jgi:hypothetical protein
MFGGGEGVGEDGGEGRILGWRGRGLLSGGEAGAYYGLCALQL